VAVSVVYSDLDGTMVGPGGCFFRAADRALTLEPAKALLELHAAGVALVLVSGRTRPQLVEACRIFGADGYVGELGAVMGWDGGRAHELLSGEMPGDLPGPPRVAVLASGAVDDLLDRNAGRVEYHAPWHEGHESDVMLRGWLDTAATDAWLAERGLGWLQLTDNGVLPAVPSPSTLVGSGEPPHVYHLLPRGLSKGLAVARDIARRGLRAADAIAVGDSLSDLSMAEHVGRMWVVAGRSGTDQRVLDAMAPLPNARLTDAPVGAGWTQAIRDALAR
jgi:phosphoglycolate phosphatase-like HAD superfamily hydrolase